MIGNISRSNDFQATLRYVSRDDRLSPLLDTLACTELEGAGSVGMALEMDDLAMRSRSKRPCLHVSLSPEKGDLLNDVQWGEVATQYLDGMGLEDHQFALYLHHDEDYGEGTQQRIHAHIVANLVGADGRQADVYNNFFRSQTVLRDIEQGVGLEHRPSWWEVARDKAIAKEQAQQPQHWEKEATVQPLDTAPPPEPTSASLQSQVHKPVVIATPSPESISPTSSSDLEQEQQQQWVEAIAPQLRSLILKYGTPCQGGALAKSH